MKKLLTVLMVCMMALSLTACGGNQGKEDPKSESSNITVGFVTDVGGIDDKSFNQTTYAGLKKFAEEFGLTEGADKDYYYVESKADTDYVPNITSFVDEKKDLIGCAGYMFSDSVAAVADAYPDQKIIVIDVNWLDAAKYTNVMQVGFAVQEGTYMVGIAAGMKANELGVHHVGMIIGGEGASMDPFYAGYQQGVWSVCPDCIIDYVNVDSYIDSAKGKTAAATMYNAGACVIFACAGSTGNGVISEAAERRKAGEEVWVIGVDTDQYYMGYYDDAQTQSAVLTSAMKRVDTALYDACVAVKNGTFQGGVYTYNLKNGGVGVPDTNPNLSEDVLKAINEATEAVKAGTLEISPAAVYGDTDTRVNGRYGG